MTRELNGRELKDSTVVIIFICATLIVLSIIASLSLTDILGSNNELQKMEIIQQSCETCSEKMEGILE